MKTAFQSPPDMLSWQYREIIAELQELQRHAADPTCPCVQHDSGENCLMKHSLGVRTLAAETAAMDPRHQALLADLAEEALELHVSLKDLIVCGKEHGKPRDVEEWSRSWRKKIEPIYYSCPGAKAKSKLNDPDAIALVPGLIKAAWPYLRDRLLATIDMATVGDSVTGARWWNQIDFCNTAEADRLTLYNYRPVRELLAYLKGVGPKLQVCSVGFAGRQYQITASFVTGSQVERRIAAFGPAIKEVASPDPKKRVWLITMPESDLKPQDLLGGKQLLPEFAMKGEQGRQAALFDPRDWLKYQGALPGFETETPRPKPQPGKYRLYPFQQAGVTWLLPRARAILADEMGLGKTPQAIHWGAERRPVLVVVPAALIYNWEREIKYMWRPGDSVVVLTGQAIPQRLPDWTITSYGRLADYLPAMKKSGFQAIILDEAHNVKNLEAQRTKHVLELVDPVKPEPSDKPIGNCLVVTGTPILNRPVEIFPLLVLMGTQRRSDYRQFLATYSVHEMRGNRIVYQGAKNLPYLYNLIRPMMLRRKKADVLKDLPPKTQTPLLVPISNADEYRRAERDFLTWLAQRKGNEAALRASAAEIITRMNALRQLAALGKIKPVADWLQPCSTGGGKVVLFSSFVEPLKALAEIKGSSIIYSGADVSATRQEKVDSFQQGGACYFMGTVGAAGVGITLTAANRVVFLDLPWTPGGKLQAEDRAHRIGQTRPVEIVNVLARGTIDERMLAILAEKEYIIAQAVDGKTREQALQSNIAQSLIGSYLHRPQISDVEQYTSDVYDAEVIEQPVAGVHDSGRTCTDCADPWGSRCRDPQTGWWISKKACGFAPEAGATNFTTAYGTEKLTRYEFRHKIVDLESLVVSHDPETLAPNPNYPAELQPRLRTRAASRVQVDNIAKNLDADVLLTDVHAIDRGSPIVSDRNEVESGNGRTMGLMLAARRFPEKYANYKEELKRRLSEFGLRPQDFKAAERPVLVRERLTKVDRTKFTQEANSPALMGISAIEQARTDSRKITATMLAGLTIGDNESIEDAIRSSANKDIATGFLSSIPSQEQAKLVDAKGVLNQDGVRRITMAMFCAAFPGEAGLKLAEMAFESIDMDIRHVVNALSRSLGPIGRLEAFIADNQRRPELTISTDIAAAANTYAGIRRTPGLTVPKYLAQSQMFERVLSPFQETVLEFMGNNSRSAKRMAVTFTAYAEKAVATPPPQQMGMMIDKPVGKEELWELAANSGQEKEAPAMLIDPGLVSAKVKPRSVTIYKTTIEQHFRESKDMHDGSIRVHKPNDTTLVYLGCARGHKWMQRSRQCLPRQSVIKIIFARDADLDVRVAEWKTAGIKVVDRADEQGVEPATLKVKATFPGTIVGPSLAEIAEALEKAK